MAKRTDEAAAARKDARRLERQASSRTAYPPGTKISRPNMPSRMFNLRLSEEQYVALERMARKRHLPVSTMARAWLLDRLDVEQQTG